MQSQVRREAAGEHCKDIVLKMCNEASEITLGIKKTGGEKPSPNRDNENPDRPTRGPSNPDTPRRGPENPDGPFRGPDKPTDPGGPVNPDKPGEGPEDPTEPPLI